LSEDPIASAIDDGIVVKEADGMTTAQDSGNHDTLITGDELARMPDHDLTELIDGRIVPLSPTNTEHGRLEANVAAALHSFTRTQNFGLVMVGEVGIFTRSNPDRVRGADVVFISHAQYERRTKSRGFLDVAPELVVEILSPERPDTDQKVVEYLAIGVRLVLVVDPPGRTISAHRPNDAVEHYREPDVVPCDDVMRGFGLPVAAVFEI
jgi:Uma2 family endonuclease